MFYLEHTVPHRSNSKYQRGVDPKIPVIGIELSPGIGTHLWQQGSEATEADEVPQEAHEVI